jgi:membrane protease YdiL (CAAX protease family)
VLVAVAAALGAAAGTVAWVLQVAGAGRVERAPAPRPGQHLRDVAILLVSALVEEALFRVALIAVIGVPASAAVFGVIHAIRGEGRGERIASAITATIFGFVTGWAWVEHRSLAQLVAFHALYNISWGLVLGGAATDPVSNDRQRPTATWPLVLAWRRPPGAALLVLSELVPLAAAAPLLAGSIS